MVEIVNTIPFIRLFDTLNNLTAYFCCILADSANFKGSVFFRKYFLNF